MTSLTYRPRSSPIATLVLAHGAGANQEHPFMVCVATGLAHEGVLVVTFDFPYTEAGRKLPDRPDVLQACMRAVIADVCTRGRKGTTLPPLFIGGKSLGARMASHLAADGEPCVAGLVCLGYPLHPPGKPEKLRVEHLSRIQVPVLFVQGSRDPFGGAVELGAHTGAIEGEVTIVAIEGGDHSFHVPKRVADAGVVMHRVTGEIVRWMLRPQAQKPGAAR